VKQQGLPMLHDVVSASYKGGYRIEITFDDGKAGVVEMLDNLVQVQPAMGCPHCTPSRVASAQAMILRILSPSGSIYDFLGLTS
jgi:hypothetical protein